MARRSVRCVQDGFQAACGACDWTETHQDYLEAYGAAHWHHCQPVLGPSRYVGEVDYGVNVSSSLLTVYGSYEDPQPWKRPEVMA